MAEHEGFLRDVYNAKDAAAVAMLYDRWAKTYDAEMANAGYRHPSICLALLSRHLKRGAQPVLDAGAGTGLIGEWLGIMGYPVVDALDISEGMLAVAKTKNCYRQIHVMALGVDVPLASECYHGIISSGVFTSGHVGAEGLSELVRLCAKGGVIVLTVKNALWEKDFASAVAADSRISLVELTAPYVSMPSDPATTPSRGVVLRVN